jgi:hypothetical protein
VLLLTIIYTINLPVVRPRSCRVIYYFDAPALGRRHQSFGRVRHQFWIHQDFLEYYYISIIIYKNKKIKKKGLKLKNVIIIKKKIKKKIKKISRVNRIFP